jgi:hypothetical protein
LFHRYGAHEQDTPIQRQLARLEGGRTNDTVATRATDQWFAAAQWNEYNQKHIFAVI